MDLLAIVLGVETTGARDSSGLYESTAVVDEREVWNLELCVCVANIKDIFSSDNTSNNLSKI